MFIVVNFVFIVFPSEDRMLLARTSGPPNKTSFATGFSVVAMIVSFSFCCSACSYFVFLLQTKSDDDAGVVVGEFDSCKGRIEEPLCSIRLGFVGLG